jgi:hypothetical protein
VLILGFTQIKIDAIQERGQCGVRVPKIRPSRRGR